MEDAFAVLDAPPDETQSNDEPFDFVNALVCAINARDILLAGQGDADQQTANDRELQRWKNLLHQNGIIKSPETDEFPQPDETHWENLVFRAAAFGLPDEWLPMFHNTDPAAALTPANLSWRDFQAVDKVLTELEAKSGQVNPAGKEKKKRGPRKKKDPPAHVHPDTPLPPTWDEICEYAALQGSEAYAPTMYNQKIQSFGKAHGLDENLLYTHFRALITGREEMSDDHLNEFANRVGDLVNEYAGYAVAEAQAKQEELCQTESPAENAEPDGTGASTAESGTGTTPSETVAEELSTSRTLIQTGQTINPTTGEVTDRHWVLDKLGWREYPEKLNDDQAAAIIDIIETYAHKAKKYRENGETLAKAEEGKMLRIRNVVDRLLFAWGAPKLPRFGPTAKAAGQIKQWFVQTLTGRLSFSSEGGLYCKEPAKYEEWKKTQYEAGKGEALGIVKKVEYSLGRPRVEELMNPPEGVEPVEIPGWVEQAKVPFAIKSIE